MVSKTQEGFRLSFVIDSRPSQQTEIVCSVDPQEDGVLRLTYHYHEISSRESPSSPLVPGRRFKARLTQDLKVLIRYGVWMELFGSIPCEVADDASEKAV